MESKPTIWGEVDERGRLVIPVEIAGRYGLQPGARVRLDDGVNSLRIHRPATHLNKIYIEPTDHCNLDCVTCIRNVWDNSMGRMKAATFDRILEGIPNLSTIPAVFFGGLGEPLYHPRTPEWVRRVKELGGRVELITNGTMLTEKKARQLIDAGLDVLWVSIDGASPESYADVRLGAELHNVIANVKRFSNLRKPSHRPVPEIGVAFVAMKRNIHDLPGVLKLGRKLKALHFSVSNVLPYTQELDAERLYSHSLKNIAYMPSPWLSHLNIPKMDFDQSTQESLIQAFNSGYNVTFAGNNLGGANDVCNFIESGSMSIGWQGDVSPCLPLLHTHTSYLHGKPRLNHKHVIGNVASRDLLDLWLDPEYITYRERVHRFAFAPCTFCGGCEMAEANQEDCFTNVHPACGGCLWAQGVIQCP